MTSKVSKCSVDTCTYYANNNCVAPEIEVNFDAPNVKARSNEQTMCRTFQQKNS